MRVLEISATDRERALEAAVIMGLSPKSHFPISQLAAKVNMPEKKLKAVFKHIYGMGLYTYLRQLRMVKAKELLMEGKPIKLIIHAIGYENESNFCKAFRKEFNESPMKWMKSEMKKVS